MLPRFTGLRTLILVWHLLCVIAIVVLVALLAGRIDAVETADEPLGQAVNVDPA